MINNSFKLLQGVALFIVVFLYGLYDLLNMNNNFTGGYSGILIAIGLSFGFKLIYNSVDKNTQISPKFRSLMIVVVVLTIIPWVISFLKAFKII